MIVRHAALSTALIALLTFQSAVGEDFKCFQCSSDRDEWCENPLANEREATECDHLEHQAKILFQKTKNVFKGLFQSIISKDGAPSDQNFHYACLKEVSTLGGMRVVKRKCTLDTSEVRDEDGHPLENECASKTTYTSYCDICKTDSCNSAPALAMHQIVFLVGCLLLKLLW
ncbi:uncharacterized protein LOC135939999 [Cloeon dipterum]|uniref:uncharacterized protein LOC135939999 n=1 Tax=Cloeon dipterum TaxID=197152 RepID=UPI00321FD7FF